MKKDLRHMISLKDFSTNEILEIIKSGKDMYDSPEYYSQRCKGKILASLFYEPSTRTKFSFEAAMLRLGGNIIGFSDVNTSSVSKGESIADTIRVVSNYADIACMRHPLEGAPKLASEFSTIPTINAGDGSHLHPTQTLTDLLTIYTHKGTLQNHTIGLCGDLKYGRTVHSLIKAMTRFSTKKFILISPEELRLPDCTINHLKKNYDIEIQEARNIEDVIDQLDILYMTRIQKERFEMETEYERLKDSFVLTKDKLFSAKEDMIIMHPLPRVNEISPEVDEDKRAIYFHQTKLGLYVRMALIDYLLNSNPKNQDISDVNIINTGSCKNKKCITNWDRHAVPHFESINVENTEYKCSYCDRPLKKKDSY